MKRASNLVSAAVGVGGALVLVGCATTREPVLMTAEDADGVFAAECGMAAILQRSTVRPNTDFYATMTDVFSYWTDRHVEITPDAARREAQEQAAAEQLNARIGGQVNIMELGVVLSECRARRGELENGTPG